MSTYSFKLFGSYLIQDDAGNTVHFRTDKERALLAYLLVEADRAHHREQLMDLLWPGLPTRSARSALRQVLSLLRKDIPPAEATDETISLLQTDKQMVQINVEFPYIADVAFFRQAMAAAKAQRGPDWLLNEAYQQGLQQAVDCYDGPFLFDYTVDDSSIFEEWAQIQRESFRHQLLDGLHELATINLHRGNYAFAEAFARRQIEIDNLSEIAYQQLMEILARAGQAAQAVIVYEKLSRLLRAELGMAPGSRTTALYERIRAGALDADEAGQLKIRGYELRDRQGEGAFGAVYLATQRAVNRAVAIKVIKPEHASKPDFIRRFESEAQIIARLEHPHIVPLYDYWREPAGAFLVMRWLDGGTLETRLTGEPLPIPQTLTTMDQLTAALYYAHEQGVVHRDIKPANILLDNNGNAYLSDFGIAKDLLRDLDLTHGEAMIGSPAYISPEQVLNEPVTPQTDIYTLGVVLFELLTGEKPFRGASLATLIYKHVNESLPLAHELRPELPTSVDDIIQRATAKRPEERYADARELADALKISLGHQENSYQDTLLAAQPELLGFNPYRGLHAFQEADVAIFFGRTALIEKILDRWHQAPLTQSLPAHRFLAIVGPSGSGKSSVAKAGVIPALRSGAVPGSADWYVTDMVPGSHPFEELEIALRRVASDAPADLLTPLHKDKRGLVRVLRHVLPVGPGGRPGQLLLVIDQFEELFTLVEDESHRRAFIDSLLTALMDTRSQLRLLITLRADFYDRPLQHPGLGEFLRQQTQVILPLTAPELSAAIRRPASYAGVVLDEGLAEAIIADVADQPGALPLLQYTLMELYERRADRCMTHQAYREIGGVLGALGRRADELFRQMPEQHQQLAKQLFLRLVTLGEGSEDTRRRVLVTELEQLGNSQPILNLYGTHRLLTFDRDPHTRLPTVEVAHEALLREWSRLRDWLEVCRDDIRQQRQLALLAQEWQAAGEESSFLIRGTRLEQFDAWQQSASVALTPCEINYLRACRRAATARQAAADAHERTRNNLRRGLIGVLSLGLIVAALLAYLVNNQRLVALQNGQEAYENAEEAQINLTLAQRNEQQALANLNRAESQRLAAEASNLILRGRSPEVAALLALKGLMIQYTPEADLALQRATAQTFPSRLLQTGGVNEINTMTLSENETILLTQLRVDPPIIQGWDVRSGNMIWQTPGELIRYPKSVQPAEVAVIISAPKFDTVALLDITTGDVIHLFEDPLFEGLEFPPFADSTSDASRLTLATPDGTTILYDTQSLAEIDRFVPDFGEDQRPIFSHLSPDGSRIAAIGRTDILVWDVETGEQLIRLQQDETEFSWSGGFSPDNRFLVSEASQFNPNVQLWDLATGKRVPIEPGHPLIWHFSPNSRLFATLDGSWGERVRVISLPDGKETQLYGHTSTIWDIDFSQDSRTLISASTDSSVRLWDVETGQQSQILSGHSHSTYNAVFAANDTMVFSGGRDEDIRIWDLQEGSDTDRLARSIGPESFFINHDGTLMLTEGSEGGSQLIDIASGQTVQEWPDLFLYPNSNWNGQLFSDQRETVFLISPTATGERVVVEVDINSGAILASYGEVGADWYGMTHIPGTDDILVARPDSVDRIATQSGQVKFSFARPSGPASARGDVVATADGRYAVAVTSDNGSHVTLFDLLENTEVWSKTYQEGVQAVAISDSGRYVAYPTSTAAIVVEVETGRELFELHQHTQSILVVAFSPDEHSLLTASVDGTGTLWNLKDGSILRRFEFNGAAIAFGRFSPDGNIVYLSTGSEMRSASIDINELILSTCNRLLRDLTAEERRIYNVDAEPTCPKFGANKESSLAGSRSNSGGRTPALSLSIVLSFAGIVATFKRNKTR